jgi:hypothetical protein
MKVEPKLKQRPARRAVRLGTRVSANLSGLWRLACLVAQCAVEPAQAAVLEVGLSKPHPEPSKAIAAAPWSAGGFSGRATRPSEYACRRVFPFLALFHDSPCPASLPEMTVSLARYQTPSAGHLAGRSTARWRHSWH